MSLRSGNNSLRTRFRKYLFDSLLESSLHVNPWVLRKCSISVFAISSIGLANTTPQCPLRWTASIPDRFEMWAPRSNLSNTVSSQSSRWWAVKITLSQLWFSLARAFASWIKFTLLQFLAASCEKELFFSISASSSSPQQNE